MQRPPRKTGWKKRQSSSSGHRTSAGARSGRNLDHSGDDLRARARQWQQQVDELAAEIERVRLAYDRFFMAIDKRQPLRERIDLDRLARGIRLPQGAKSALRFRQQSLMQRLSSLRSYWDRSVREIEEGHFRRRHSSSGPVQLAPHRQDEATADHLEEGSDAYVEHSRARPGPYRDLYERYVAARREIEGAAGKVPSYAAFEGELERQQKVHAERFDGALVRYDLRTDNGKVRLVARVRRRREAD